MLNYEPKVINTQDPKIRKAYKGGKFKGHGVIKLLDEIWGLKKNITPLKVIEAYEGFEEVLKGLKGQAGKTAELRILEYLSDNTDLSLKIWRQAEKLLIEKGLLKQGGLMQDVREVIKEKGVWEGMRKGMQEGMQKERREGMQKGRQEGMRKGMQKERREVVLNMLKEKADISFIAKVTGLSEAAIKKLKNNS